MLVRLFYLFFLLFIFSFNSTYASSSPAAEKSHDNFKTVTEEYFDKFKTVHRIVDDQINVVKTKSVCPSQDRILYVENTLRPIEIFFSTLGNRSDPTVNVLMTAFDQFKLSLNAYYELNANYEFSNLTQSPYVQLLTPELQIEFNKWFKGLMQNFVANTGMCLKVYLKMIFYETPENYTKFFPENVMMNHELFMTQATVTLQNLYLNYFMSAIRLDADPSQQEFFSAIYKVFKSFSFTWQKIILDSWSAHLKAFQRISLEGYNHNLPSIQECSKTLESLMMHKDWKKKLDKEKFILLVLERFKDHPITIIDNKDISYIILKGSPLLFAPGPSTIEKPIDTTVTKRMSPEQSLLTVNTDKAVEEPKDTPGVAKEDSLESFDESGTTSGTTIKSSIIEQATDIFKFYSNMEPADSLPPVQTKEQKKKPRKNRQKTKNAPSQKIDSSPSAQNPQNLGIEKERIVLTLGRKKTPEAIVDFLGAFNQISPSAKEALHPGVRKAIWELANNPQLKLGKAYKLMLGIIPHVGKFEIDRGKGSHALITLYLNGHPKK